MRKVTVLVFVSHVEVPRGMYVALATSHVCGPVPSGGTRRKESNRCPLIVKPYEAGLAPLAAVGGSSFTCITASTTASLIPESLIATSSAVISVVDAFASLSESS